MRTTRGSDRASGGLVTKRKSEEKDASPGADFAAFMAKVQSGVFDEDLAPEEEIGLLRRAVSQLRLESRLNSEDFAGLSVMHDALQNKLEGTVDALDRERILRKAGDLVENDALSALCRLVMELSARIRRMRVSMESEGACLNCDDREVLITQLTKRGESAKKIIRQQRDELAAANLEIKRLKAFEPEQSEMPLEGTD